MELNFKIIEFEPKLKNLYDACIEAQTFVDSNPDHSCMISRKAVEEIVNVILKEEKCRVPSKSSLNDKIEVLKYYVSSSSIDCMYRIKSIGNVSAHKINSQNSTVEAYDALSCLFYLIDVELRKYNKFLIKPNSLFLGMERSLKYVIITFTYVIPIIMSIVLAYINLWTLVYSVFFIFFLFFYNKYENMKESRKSRVDTWNDSYQTKPDSPNSPALDLAMVFSFITIPFFGFSWYYVLGFLVLFIIWGNFEKILSKEALMSQDVYVYLTYSVILNVSTGLGNPSLLPITIPCTLFSFISVFLKYRYLM